MTHHPPLASQATAHGVVGGWNDNRERRWEGWEMTGDGEHTAASTCLQGG
jgi:hypothetical protein